MKKYIVASHNGCEMHLPILCTSKRDAYSIYGCRLLDIINSIRTMDKFEYEEYNNVFTLSSLKNIKTEINRLMEKYEDGSKVRRTSNGYCFSGIPCVTEIFEVDEYEYKL